MYVTHHVIRMAADDDALALRRLARLASREPLAEPVLIGEINGTTVAAVSLDDGRTIADPFIPTDHLIVALRARAKGEQAFERMPSLRERIRAGVPVAARRTVRDAA
jgi:hypothetical protein